MIWAENASTAGTPNYTYYDSDGLKLDRNVFARFVQRSQDGRLQAQAELQYRGVRFETMGTDNDQVAINVPRDSATFDFLNPKVGLDYRLNDSGPRVCLGRHRAQGAGPQRLCGCPRGVCRIAPSA